jgi:excisionase family DNA binding protein
MDQEAVSVAQFCKRYGISRRTFYEEVKRKRLRARKLGAKTIVLRHDELAYVASLPALKSKS